MNIRKAVITAAGRGVHLYPAADTVQKAMLPIVDCDGLAKPVLQVIAEEALASGVEEICVVCAPGDEDAYRRQFSMLQENLARAYKGVSWAEDEAQRLGRLLGVMEFAVQEEPRGYGQAVACARDFAGGEPFLLLLGDHLYNSEDPERRCAEQLTALAAQEDCPVAAVRATRENLIRRYGTLSGRREPGQTGVYRIETILEKPSVSAAEQQLQTPGLRAGYYLCFFGMYVLTSTVFELLDEQDTGGPVQLTPALHELAQRERYLALEVRGTRFDIASKLGLFEAQLALGLSGDAHDEVLAALVERLAEMQPRHR